MNKSQLFTEAHKMTKRIMQTGDNYRATFGLCLAYLYAENKKPKKMVVMPVSDDTIKAIKADLKAKGYRVSIRKNKQVYANGGITINPYGKDKFRFEDDEILAVAETLVKYNVDSPTWGDSRISTIVGNLHKLKLYYGSYFAYINEIKVVA